jgi:hypothetical protein
MRGWLLQLSSGRGTVLLDPVAAYSAVLLFGVSSEKPTKQFLLLSFLVPRNFRYYLHWLVHGK